MAAATATPYATTTLGLSVSAGQHQADVNNVLVDSFTLLYRVSGHANLPLNSENPSKGSLAELTRAPKSSEQEDQEAYCLDRAAERIGDGFAASHRDAARPVVAGRSASSSRYSR